MTMTEKVFAAIQKGKPVFAPDGSKCIVIKWKAGRAKVRRLIEGTIQEAWIPIGSLTIKE
jgi:hypothetical protein